MCRSAHQALECFFGVLQVAVQATDRNLLLHQRKDASDL